MTINQVIKLAQKGKLKDIAVKSDIDAIVGFLNLALIEMYKRFPLKVGECIIALEDGKVIYDMPSDYMWIVSAYQEVPTDDPDTVYSPIPINEEDNSESLNTIGFSQVQIPLVTTGAYISVIYIAAPPFIDYDADTATYSYDDIEGNTISISQFPVPPQMIEAVLEYVAYQANNTFSESGKLLGDSYLQQFEASCMRIEQRGMLSSDDLDMKPRDMKGMP